MIPIAITRSVSAYFQFLVSCIIRRRLPKDSTYPSCKGNGRMSRLIMNFVLKSKGYPMLNIPYEGRNSYYNALERAQVSKNDDIFMSWFIRRYVKAYKAYLV